MDPVPASIPVALKKFKKHVQYLRIHNTGQKPIERKVCDRRSSDTVPARSIVLTPEGSVSDPDPVQLAKRRSKSRS
jgi:hypothetical protein